MKTKIVLFFDINSTILADDKSSALTLEDALNIHLASTVWTKPEGPARFNLRLFEGPTGSSSSMNTVISGYKHYKREMPADHKQYLKTFSATAEGREHAYFYRRLLQALQSRPPMSIFDSFFAVLAWLRDVAAAREGYEWCVCLRTYGDDLPLLLQRVRDFAQGTFPVADTHVALLLSKGGPSLKVDGTTTLTAEQDVVDWIYSKEGVIGVQDDYFYWRDNGFSTEAGKPVWVPCSTADTRIVPLFFDDNYRFGSDNSILDVRVQDCPRGPFASAFRGASFAEPRERSMAVTEQVCVKARMFEAISNTNYFVNHLRLRLSAMETGTGAGKSLFVRMPNERELGPALTKTLVEPSAVERHLGFLKSQFAHKTEFMDWVVADTPWVHSERSTVLGFCQSYRCILNNNGNNSDDNGVDKIRHGYVVQNIRTFSDSLSSDAIVELLAKRIGAVDPFAEVLFWEAPSSSPCVQTLPPKPAGMTPCGDFVKIGPGNFGEELRRAAGNGSQAGEGGAREDVEVNGARYKKASWAFWTLVEDYVWVFLLAGERENFGVLKELAQNYAAQCGANKVIVTSNGEKLSIFKITSDMRN